MKALLVIILGLLAFILIVSSIQWARIRACIKVGNNDINPWQQLKPNAPFKVLYAGDSTAVGTGLSDNTDSTAGLLGHDFPDIDLENYSRNGLRLQGLADILKKLQGKHFDLAIFQIGANDIIYFTPLSQIRQDQRRVLDLARNIAQRIIILHSGDIGQSPLFICPITWIYTWRSWHVRKIYIQSQDERVSYIDIYTLNKGKNLSDCYGRDHLHLNKKGYALWYGYIKDQLLRLHWLP